MDEREFSPEEITKAMKLCYGGFNIHGEVCSQCPYGDPFPLSCTKELLKDAVLLLDKTFGGGDTDGD